MEQKEYIERDKAIDTVACKPDMTPDERYGVIKRIRAIPAADVREVVLCKDCKYWKDRHIKQKDGAERQYRDGEPMYVDLNVGVNVGSMCCYEVGRGWGGMDKRVFRNQDDFCSRGEKRPVKYEKWWGIVDGKYPLRPNCCADMRGK